MEEIPFQNMAASAREALMIPEGAIPDPAPGKVLRMEYTVADAVIEGALSNIEHAAVCPEPKIQMQVAGEKRRILCLHCQAFVQLPGTAEYDAAWQQLADAPVLELPKIVSGGPQAGKQITPAILQFPQA